MRNKLTTIEMIKVLKEGQTAICTTPNHTDASVEKKRTPSHSSPTIIWKTGTCPGRDLSINDYTLEHTWEIECEYVSFIEAIQAWMDGSTIECHIDGKVYDTYTQFDSGASMIELYEIKDGKWVIL